MEATGRIAENVWIAPDADVLGNVSIQKDSSVWFHATVRAEDAAVTIGEGTNIQDNCVIHVDPGYPVTVGNRVTVGHGAILHGCSIADETLIGMGAIILNGASIGRHCIVGAGALVTERMQVPDGMMVLGVPGRVVRPLTEAETERLLKSAETYIAEARRYAGIV
ncbi:MAG: gamma carbonic anhydrase family protein [Lachnospiraceae bacterium]|nr:gamma carbonic anhydrase family protein [Lachnospiraceae bacterium]